MKINVEHDEETNVSENPKVDDAQIDVNDNSLDNDKNYLKNTNNSGVR